MTISYVASDGSDARDLCEPKGTRGARTTTLRPQLYKIGVRRPLPQARIALSATSDTHGAIIDRDRPSDTYRAAVSKI
jgi:hypothetical protein